MKTAKVQGHAALREEMKAVARGEKPAPHDAATTSYESVDALLRLLTPQNRALLAVIRDQRPQSIAELAQITGRAQSNLTRTLGKLEAIGFVRFQTHQRRKIPIAPVASVRIDIDPYAPNDRMLVL